MDERVQTPMSEVNALEFQSFLEGVKTKATPIEVDLRDAKRRINACKPKKTPAKPAGDDVEDSGESA